MPRGAEQDAQSHASQAFRLAQNLQCHCNITARFVTAHISQEEMPAALWNVHSAQIHVSSLALTMERLTSALPSEPLNEDKATESCVGVDIAASCNMIEQMEKVAGTGTKELDLQI
mmetsp:Transcript_137563/g.243098  ORF Transcript_137563/g.243098 Transcript_137563/m.243098 type:complete len:116 (+) Transcript_137563:949-1296(+)